MTLEITPGGTRRARVRSSRIRRGSSLQALTVFLVVAGLTVTHFLLTIGGVGRVVTDLVFVGGVAVAAGSLIVTNRIVARRTDDLLSEFVSAQLGSIEALDQALNVRDPYTSDHADGVVELSVRVARRMDVGDEEIEAIRIAALFHDIGKIGIPDSILRKPGPLDAAEWKLMRRHTLIGAEILAPLGFLDPVVPIVRSSHERWDGRGYPEGLAGDEIPLGARIITVCDAFDAMTTDRVYRDALPSEAALERIRAAAGGQFDSEVVEAFMAVVESGAAASAASPARDAAANAPEPLSL